MKKRIFGVPLLKLLLIVAVGFVVLVKWGGPVKDKLMSLADNLPGSGNKA